MNPKRNRRDPLRRLLARREVAALTRRLAAVGARGWIVGGAARDLLLGLEVPDVDVAIDTDPFAIARALEASGTGTFVPLSESGPRVARIAGRTEIDVAEIEGGDILADLARRDFAVNAIAIPLAGDAKSRAARRAGATSSAWIDPFEGAADLRARRLTLISEENLRDDPLRVLRAARLYATRGLRPDARTTAACRRAAPLLPTAAAERIRAELEKLLAAPRARPALAWAAGAAILGPALGLALDDRTARRVAAGPFDVPAILRREPEERAVLRLAILAWRAEIGPDGAAAWLAGRRFPRAVARRVSTLLGLAARATRAPRPLRPARSPRKDVRERWAWIRDAGADVPAALALARAAAPGARTSSRLAALARAARTVHTPPRVTGDDVVAWLGTGPGPAVGAWLRELEIEGLRGAVTTRSEARRWLLARSSDPVSGAGPTRNARPAL